MFTPDEEAFIRQLVPDETAYTQLMQFLQAKLPPEPELPSATQPVVLASEPATHQPDEFSASFTSPLTEHLLARLGDALPGTIFIYEAILQNPVFISRSISQMLGYTPEEIMVMGSSIVPTLMHADDIPRFQQHLARYDTAEDGEALIFNFRMRHADGTWRWFTSYETIFDRSGDGQVRMILGIAQDVTAHRESEAHSRLLEQRFQTAFHTSPIGMTLADREGRFVEVNDRFAHMLGYAPDELIGAYVSVVSNPEDMEIDTGYARRMRRGEFDYYQIEKRYIHRQGYDVYTILSVSAIRNPEGKLIYYVGQMQDITERKRLEADMKASHKLYEELLGNTPALISRSRTTRQDIWKLEYLNPQVRDLHGFSAEQILANQELFYQQIVPEDYARMQEVFAESVRHKRPFSWEGRIVVDDETRWVNIEATPAIQPNGDIVWYAAEFDITDRKRLQRAEVEGARLRTALEKERELNLQKTGLMTRVSHEFRTPLAIIQTASETLQRYRERLTPEKVESKFSQINDAIAHLTMLLDDILMVLNSQSAPTAYRPHTQDVIELTQRVIRRLQRSTCAQHIFNTTFASDLHPLEIDGDLLTSILNHLLTNACKYSAPDSHIAVMLSLDDDALVLRVADQGIGIPESDQALVFEPFYRAGNLDAQGGLGLGLSLVRDAVVAHQGEIHIESKLNIGTTITVRLPIAPPA